MLGFSDEDEEDEGYKKELSVLKAVYLTGCSVYIWIYRLRCALGRGFVAFRSNGY